MKIENSVINDIPLIFEFYKKATEYMKSKGQVSWPIFSNEMIVEEIVNNRQWKLIIENEIACIWATTLNDEVIWGEENKDASIYIHRIATKPSFKGQNLVKQIVVWAKKYARKNKLEYIRMDTVGLNHGLIKHYKKLGFEFLGTKKLLNTANLPEHYKEDVVCYFQIKME